MNEESAFAPLLRDVRELKHEALRILSRVADEHPEWVTTGDARSIAAQTSLNTLRFAELALVHVEVHLHSPEWWTSLRGGQPPVQQVEREFHAYTECTKFALFHLMFSGLEGAFRAILRALDPHAATGSRAEFEGVARCLLQTHLAAPERDWDLITLLRLVRNTVHNEGVHRPKSGGDRVVRLDGEEYVFADAKPIEFVTWAFLLSRVRDVLEMQERIIFSPKLLALSRPIPSPLVTVLEEVD